MSVQTYRPTINAGQVYMRPEGSAQAMKAIGNVSVLELEITEDEKTLADYTAPGGGQWAAISRVTGVNAKMTLHDLDPVNLARAVYGSTSDTTGSTVAAETATAYQGGLIRLDHPDPTSVTLTWGGADWAATHAYALNALIVDGGKKYKCTTAGTSGASEPTWPASGTVSDGTAVWTYQAAWSPVADTDYEVRPEGILILEGEIADGDPLSIAYTYGNYSAVEALTSGSVIYEMAFGGLNEANSNSPVVVDLYRLKVSAAKALSFIGSDFAALEVTGKVLLDATKTGTGISKYFRVQMV
jgi:hypothetical protein